MSHLVSLLGRINNVDENACRMFEYTPDELIGKNVSVLVPPPYHEQHDSYMQNYLRTGIKRIIGQVRGAWFWGAAWP